MIKQFIKSGVILLTVAAFSVNAFAATAREPKANGQNKDHWCWATAAKIVAEHNGGVTLSSTAQVLTDTNNLHKGTDPFSGKSEPYFGLNSAGEETANGVQRSIVIHIKDSDADNGGGDSDKTKALQYASQKI